ARPAAHCLAQVPDLAGPDQLLGLPASPAADRGLPLSALDRASFVLGPGAGRRAVPGHLDRDVLGDLPAGRTADAECRTPAGQTARRPVRPGPPPGPAASPGTGARAQLPWRRLGRAAASWCHGSTIVPACHARPASRAAAAATAAG